MGFVEIDWDHTMVVTRHTFHDDWFGIAEVLRSEFSNKDMLNPFHMDKALFQWKDQQEYD